MRLLSLGVVVCLMLMLSGCATGRIRDLKDCGSLSGGVGLGLGIQMRLGALAHPSLGVFSSGPRFGFENRYLVGAWDETEGFWPFSAPLVADAGPAVSVDGHPLNLSYARICDSQIHRDSETFRLGQWINLTSVDKPPSSGIKRAMDLELGASLLVVSGRIGVNPLEIIDFLLGFVGVDIAKDDPRMERDESE